MMGEQSTEVGSVITRERLFDLERAMIQMPQVALRLEHYFSDGVYARELHIPKGTLLTGKIHKYANLNIVSKGDVSVLIDGQIKRVQAPFTLVAPPGAKRIIYAHEDSIWTTIHCTDETDLDKIEAHFTAVSETEYLAFCDTLRLEGE